MDTVQSLSHFINSKLSHEYVFGKKALIDNAGTERGLYFIYTKDRKVFYIGQAGYRRGSASIYKRIKNYNPCNIARGGFVQYASDFYEDNYTASYSTFKEFYDNQISKEWVIKVLNMPHASADEANYLERFCIEQFSPLTNVMFSKKNSNDRVSNILKRHFPG